MTLFIILGVVAVAVFAGIVYWINKKDQKRPSNDGTQATGKPSSL